MYVVGALGWLLLIPLSTQPDAGPLAGLRAPSADPVIWEQVGAIPFALGALMFYALLYQYATRASVAVRLGARGGRAVYRAADWRACSGSRSAS